MCIITLHTLSEVSCVNTLFCYLIFKEKRQNRALESKLVQDAENVMEIIPVESCNLILLQDSLKSIKFA